MLVERLSLYKRASIHSYHCSNWLTRLKEKEGKLGNFSQPVKRIGKVLSPLLFTRAEWSRRLLQKTGRTRKPRKNRCHSNYSFTKVRREFWTIKETFCYLITSTSYRVEIHLINGQQKDNYFALSIYFGFSLVTYWLIMIERHVFCHPN